MLDTVWRDSEDVEVKLHACKGFRVILYFLMNTGITHTYSESNSFLPICIKSLYSPWQYLTATDGVS